MEQSSSCGVLGVRDVIASWGTQRLVSDSAIKMTSSDMCENAAKITQRSDLDEQFFLQLPIIVILRNSYHNSG